MKLKPLNDAQLVSKVMRVFQSCKTRAQFEVAKKFAIRAAMHCEKVEVDIGVLNSFYDARLRVNNTQRGA